MATRKKKVAKKKATKKPLVRTRRPEKPVLDDGRLANTQHETYAQVFAQTFDPIQAMKAAKIPQQKRGWKDSRYDLLRRHPEINERIHTIVKQRLDDLCINEGWIVHKMLAVLDRAMQAEPVMGPDGEPTGEYKFDGRTATRMLELLGTNIGMFDKLKGQSGGTINITMNYGGDKPPVQIGQGATVDGQAKRVN